MLHFNFIVDNGEPDVSFNFTGNTPNVRNNRVFFNLILGRDVEEARCAVLQGIEVLEETDCKDQLR